MPLTTACSSCSSKLKVKDELLGKAIKCPKCAKVFKVEAEVEEKKVAVQAGAPEKPGKKPPPPAWGDDEDETTAWDKKKSGKKSKDDDEDDEKPKGKSKVKSKKRSGADAEFDALLEQTLLPDDTKKQILQDLSLKRSERGVWIGQPDLKMMTVRAIPKVILGVFIVTIFCAIGSIMGGVAMKELWYVVVGPVVLLWLLLAAAMTIGIPIMERKKARATAYIITNKRCICYYGGWFGSPTTESYLPDLVQHMRRMRSWFFGSDAGDIVFRSVTTVTTTHSNRGSSTSRSTVYYGFLAIRELEEIEALIRKHVLSDDDDEDDDDDDD